MLAKLLVFENRKETEKLLCKQILFCTVKTAYLNTAGKFYIYENKYKTNVLHGHFFQYIHNTYLTSFFDIRAAFELSRIFAIHLLRINA